MGAVLASLCIVAVAVAVGCGSGGSDESTISRADFVERANAVCARTRRRIEAEFAAYGESRKAQQAARAQREGKLTAAEANEAAASVAERILIPAMRRQLAELRGLGVPDDAEAEALLDAIEEGIEKAEARPERAARDGTEAFGKAGRLADEYGAGSC